MASAVTVSPSSQIATEKIMTNTSATHENTMDSMYHCDNNHTNDNSSNGSINGNVKTVSEDTSSSPSATEDENDELHLGMIENQDPDTGEDLENEDELLFLQDEEEKIMQEDTEVFPNTPEVGVTPKPCIPEVSNVNENSNLSSETPTLSREESVQEERATAPITTGSEIQQDLSKKSDQEGATDANSQSPKRDLETSKKDLDHESLHKPTKRVKIVEEKPRNLSESYDFSLKRSRIDSIDLDAHTFDFEGMGIGLSNTPGIIVDETKSSNLPPLANENANEEHKFIGVPQKHENLEPSPALRGRGYSLDFFSFGMNEDEPIPPTPSTNEGVVPDGANTDVENFEGNHNQSNHNPVVGQSAGNSVINDFESKLRPRGDSIIFDPSSFGDGGIHEANALERSRRPSISLDVDEIEIMNAPGFVEPPAPPIPDGCESRMAEMEPVDTSTTQDLHSYSDIRSNPQNALQGQMGSQSFQSTHTGERIHTGGPSEFTTTPLNNNNTNSIQPNENRPLSSLIPMSSEIILTPDAMSGSTGVLQIDQMELLNQGGRIGLYLPNARKERIAKFHSKRKMRIWRKRIKYDCRKKLADSRPRIKGRFVKRSDVDE